MAPVDHVEYAVDEPLTPRPDHERRSGELTIRELLRWGWRQLTSMRTALLLLLLLALAAIPGSVIPQQGVDALKTSQWQNAHPQLTPIYERLQLFSVYDSVWFSAIYLLLMISLVGCIVPRTAVYWRAMRAAPPPAPRNLDRLPDYVRFTAPTAPEIVLGEAADHLRGRRFRVVSRVSTGSTAEGSGSTAEGSGSTAERSGSTTEGSGSTTERSGSTTDGGGGDAGTVAAERGYLREAGNLLFHLSVLIVLAGVAVGALFGYQGGVILVQGTPFTNNLTQYDDFNPGGLFDPERMEPFTFTVDDFEIDWITVGRGDAQSIQARNFVAHLLYRERPDGPDRTYDLKVNHPLTIGGTELFLIGHGYAPVITIRDGEGNIAYSGPTIFLPTDQTFRSFGVLKAPDARPGQIGLEGEFYPTYGFTDETGPFSVRGDLLNPAISMLAYTGDLGLDDGTPQSVYVLSKADADVLTKPDGKMFRTDLAVGDSIALPDDLGTVTFEGVERWQKIQISRTPGKMTALLGVILALIGLCGSLYLRPRRTWVRATRTEAGTLVEIGGLDRSGSGEGVAADVGALAAALGHRDDDRGTIEDEEQT